jgi:hypothetical protein
VITKSGSNAFHEAYHEFLRNTQLDAKVFHQAGSPNFNSSITSSAASLGGPITRTSFSSSPTTGDTQTARRGVVRYYGSHRGHPQWRLLGGAPRLQPVHDAASRERQADTPAIRSTNSIIPKTMFDSLTSR